MGRRCAELQLHLPPELKGYLYYSVQIGNVYLITLNCTESYGEWLAAAGSGFLRAAGTPAKNPWTSCSSSLSHMPLYARICKARCMARLPNPSELSLRESILKEAPQVHARS